MAEQPSAAENKQDSALAAATRGGRGRRPSRLQALAKRLGLRLVTADALTIRRRRCGRGFAYVRSDGSPLRDRSEIRRLASLAVPPAYRDVRYAEDPSAHLQAIGRDDAGRLQYRYHPEWERVRETEKAWRLERLVDVLPEAPGAAIKLLANLGRELSGRLRRANWTIHQLEM